MMEKDFWARGGRFSCNLVFARSNNETYVTSVIVLPPQSFQDSHLCRYILTQSHNTSVVFHFFFMRRIFLLSIAVYGLPRPLRNSNLLFLRTVKIFSNNFSILIYHINDTYPTQTFASL